MKTLHDIPCPKCGHPISAHTVNARVNGHCGVIRISETDTSKIIECQCEYSSNAAVLAFIEKIETKSANFEQVINKAIEAVRADDRLKETVTIEENAPLALTQVQLETQIGTLRWVLKIMQDGE
jgi:transcription elongation factor Elf1